MQILIGYTDARGASKPVIVAGPEVSRDDQMKTWVAAKTQHRFPKGIVRLDLVDLAVSESAIFISDDVTDEQQAFTDAAAKRALDAKNKKAAEQKRAADLSAAIRAVSATAVARNSASQALNTTRQNNAEKSKLAAAQTAFDSADKAWQDAKARRDDLERPAENKITI